ncbi:unnamed protein product [Closterium sp. NIES-54]
MAATPTLNRANNIVANAPKNSDNDRNARETTGERRNKRRADGETSAPTAVDVLLGGLEVNKNAEQHPQHPSAPVAPVANVATHAADAEHAPAAHASGRPSRQRQRRRTAASSDATADQALTEALIPDQVKALLSLLQQHPASAIAAETTQPAASASAKNDAK